MKQQINFTLEEIRKLQKELSEMNVTKETTNYHLSEEYLNLFLERYSELDGQYGYIQGAILTPLFGFIKKKEPNISQEELVIKSQRLYPIIRLMLINDKVFTLIKRIKKKKINKP